MKQAIEMANNNEQQMPSSFGGLVRYFDEGEQYFNVDPKALTAFIMGTNILIIMLKVNTGL